MQDELRVGRKVVRKRAIGSYLPVPSATEGPSGDLVKMA